MTKDEALRLALEFISSISPAFICEASHHKKHEQHASNEPCPHVAKQKQVYEAIKAALEAKDEPWEQFCDSHCVWTDHHPDCKLAQRTWVGLTDEDIEQEFGFIDELLRDCVQRTEAKLKEKNT
jgi:hypothetical protein